MLQYTVNFLSASCCVSCLFEQYFHKIQFFLVSLIISLSTCPILLRMCTSGFKTRTLSPKTQMPAPAAIAAHILYSRSRGACSSFTCPRTTDEALDSDSLLPSNGCDLLSPRDGGTLPLSATPLVNGWDFVGAFLNPSCLGTL